MEDMRCPNCSGIVEAREGETYGVCKYCKHTFNVRSATELGTVGEADAKRAAAWRQELNRNLKIQESSNKARDYSTVKSYAEKLLSIMPNDFASMYFSALCDYMSGNETPYTYFLAHNDGSYATQEELELVSNKIIEYAEGKHERAIAAYFDTVYGENSGEYKARLKKAVEAHNARLKLAMLKDRDIFICHSSIDVAIAERVCNALELAGFTCWISSRNLMPGSLNYERELSDAIDHCKMMFVLSSANSIMSPECQKEVRAAFLADKAFFSLRIDPEPYEGAFKKALDKVQWLEAYGRIDEEELVSCVKRAFAKDAEEKAELERKALEARERAKTYVHAPSDALAEKRIEAFCVQIDDCVKVGTKADLPRAQQIIERALEVAPDSAEIWWRQFLINVLNKYVAELDDKSVYEKYYVPHKKEVLSSLDNEAAAAYDKFSIVANNYATNEDKLKKRIGERISTNLCDFKQNYVNKKSKLINNGSERFQILPFTNYGDSLGNYVVFCLAVSEEHGHLFDESAYKRVATLSNGGNMIVDFDNAVVKKRQELIRSDDKICYGQLQSYMNQKIAKLSSESYMADKEALTTEKSNAISKMEATYETIVKDDKKSRAEISEQRKKIRGCILFILIYIALPSVAIWGIFSCAQLQFYTVSIMIGGFAIFLLGMALYASNIVADKTRFIFGMIYEISKSNAKIKKLNEERNDNKDEVIKTVSILMTAYNLPPDSAVENTVRRFKEGETRLDCEIESSIDAALDKMIEELTKLAKVANSELKVCAEEYFTEAKARLGEGA